MTAPVMMGITSPTGSHLPVLEREVASLPAEALVFEHGAGLYSTPLLARSGVRVLCSEEHEGWNEWARWIYRGRVEMLAKAKQAVVRLPEVSLAFIDGEARHRGFLLSKCLEANVPVVIVHDTQEEHWDAYGHVGRFFRDSAYVVTHDGLPHRTTLWKLRS